MPWPAVASANLGYGRRHRDADEKMLSTLKDHWPEYLMEAIGLMMFMIGAGLFTTMLEYPAA